MAFHRTYLLFIFFLFNINFLYESLFNHVDKRHRFFSLTHSFVIGKNEEKYERYIKKIQNENNEIINFLQNELTIQNDSVGNGIKIHNNTNNKKKKKIINVRKGPSHKKENTDIQNGFDALKKGHNYQDSDIIVAVDDEVNQKAYIDLTNDCNGSANNCIHKKVGGFVNLMKNINNIRNKDKISELSDEDEENIYNDENHTIVVYDGLEEEKDLYNKYKNDDNEGMKTKVIKGTEYLGVGYDFIFGNPIGDPYLKVDPGYRDSIIKLSYPKSDEDYPKNYLNINPNGSYVRNEISCNRSENQTEISSMNEYTKELSVDASINASFSIFASFSASTGYKSALNTVSKKKDRMFMVKSYCFKYVASLSQYSQWKLTDQFLRVISLLPSYFNSLEHDETYCTPEEYKDDMKTEKCGNSVRSWMSLFKNFGTHVSTLLHLGGKITQQLKISNNEYKQLSEKGISVSVGVSGRYSLFKAGVSNNNESNESESEYNSNSSIEKETIIIGGITIFDPNDPKNFEKWADSIKNNSMPIKGEYEPLSKVLPTRLYKIYDEALNFYVLLNSPVSINKELNGDIKELNIKEKLKKAKLIHNGGSGLVVLECEEKNNFLLGFSLSIPINFSNLENFRLKTCDEDSDKCYSKMGDNLHSYLFGLCGEEKIPYLEQKAKSGSDLITLECSEKNQVIIFGFSIIVLNSNGPDSVTLYPCVYGKPSCSMQGSTDKSAVGLWIVCAHEDSLDSKFSVNIKKLEKNNISGKKKKHASICPADILFNLLFEFPNPSFGKNKSSCFSANSSCPNNFHVCSSNKYLNQVSYFSLSVY